MEINNNANNPKTPVNKIKIIYLGLFSNSYICLHLPKLSILYPYKQIKHL